MIIKIYEASAQVIELIKYNNMDAIKQIKNKMDMAKKDMDETTEPEMFDYYEGLYTGYKKSLNIIIKNKTK